MTEPRQSETDLRATDDFWRGKRCLITGADGFLAAHLAQRLIDCGSLVHGVVRNRRRTVSALDLFDLRPKVMLFYCDVRDYRGILDLIAGEKIDSVFHVAAASTVGVAARSPLATFESNIMGTVNVLEACRQSGVERVLIASSDKAYGDHRYDLPFRESHALRGLQIYDCSKSCTDLIGQTYYFQFHLPVRVTRCCNIYGPGDLNFSRLIPGTIARLLEGVPPMIHSGQAEVKRQYLFVADAVDAYLAIGRSISAPLDQAIPGAGDQAYSSCAYNIGSSPHNIRTAREVLSVIGEIMDVAVASVERSPRSVAYESPPNHQFLESDKIKGELGWQAKIELETGIRDTVAWYQTHRAALKPLYEAEILPR